MEPDPTDVRPAYDAWAATYDHDRNRTRDLDGAVLRETPLGPGSLDVLEPGCGTGKNTGWLARRARSVLGLDLSEGMLARARARVGGLPGVRFVRADITSPWPLRSDAADLVVGSLLLEHVDTLEPVFAEVARVLRPGGRYLLSELHPERQSRGAGAWFAHPGTGEPVRVRAFVHPLDDYVGAARQAGLEMVAHQDHWHPEDDPSASPPRLLTAVFRRPLPGR